MDQKKTGEFLKQLRKEKNMTQEQLAEKFYVSGRTVSRWETGSNMPDLGMLVELADFYNVDIREIIDGERKSEIINYETKDTLKKVAEYTSEEKKRLRNKMADMMIGVVVLVAFCTILFVTNGFNGAIAENGYRNMMCFTFGLTMATLVLNVLYLLGLLEKICEKRSAFFDRIKGNK